MKFLIVLSAVLFITFYAPLSSADIYSWVDKNGITHFTNYSPPPAARMVIKDLPTARRALPEKESEEKEGLLEEGPEIQKDLDNDRITVNRKEVETLEEAPYSSESDYLNGSDSDGSKNSYVSKYPIGFHRFPPELQRLKHHPNFHNKLHLRKFQKKKHHSAYRHKGQYNQPTIWDRKPPNRKKHKTGLHQKRVFGWQPPKAKNRPSAHYFAFGGGHYRGTTVKARGHWGGRASAFGSKGRFGGGRGGR
ncbi:MAG: DUF4124 domain-containing protein [Desulfobacteraceae bacterium]